MTVACLVALSACSGGTTFFGDGGIGSDGAATDDAGNPIDAGPKDGAGTPTKSGSVTISGWDYMASSTPIQGGSASASFYGKVGGSSLCTQQTVGGCTVSQCGNGTGNDGGGAAAASAGTIDVSGASKPLQLVPNGTTYDSATSQTKLLSGGEQLDVKASGAEVPAFDLKVTAPTYVTVTTPVFPTSGKLTVDRSKALALAWSGGTIGNVTAVVGANSASGSVSVLCQFPAATGSASIPAAALGNLPSSPTSASMAVQVTNGTTTVVGGWSLRADVWLIGRSESGGAASALVTIL